MTVQHIEWVDIPAGTLQRGTPLDQIDALTVRYAATGVPPAWYRKETPRLAVAVPAFRLARTPVTVAQWTAFAEATGARALSGIDEHPVVGVSWHEATAYAAWIGSQHGVDARLPTEDEWERAARGDDTREFPWGDEYVQGRANLFDLGLGTTTPVGSFPEGASPFGVLDMAGNVDEWTSTLYAPYPGRPTTSLPSRTGRPTRTSRAAERSATTWILPAVPDGTGRTRRTSSLWASASASRRRRSRQRDCAI